MFHVLCASNFMNGTEYPHDVPTLVISSHMIARAPGSICGVGKPSSESPSLIRRSNSGEPRSKTLPMSTSRMQCTQIRNNRHRLAETWKKEEVFTLSPEPEYTRRTLESFEHDNEAAVTWLIDMRDCLVSWEFGYDQNGVLDRSDVRTTNLSRSGRDTRMLCG